MTSRQLQATFIYIALLTGKADKNVIKGNTKMHEMKMT